MARRGDAEVVRCADADAVAAEAARRIREAARAAVAARGVFTLVLSGGSTPEKLYRLLADAPYRNEMPWSRTSFFLGDERFVAQDATESNWGMAVRALLDPLAIPGERRYPIPAPGPDCPTPAAAAERYEATLRGLYPGAEAPRFDLVLLGLGDDGHTASLFPGRDALAVTDRWAAETPPGVLPPPVDRVTMTFPVLNAAREALFLVAGAKKAPALRGVLAEGADVATYPAAGVRLADGRVTFLADGDALREAESP